MNINSSQARKLAEKYLLDKKTQDGEFLFIHTKGVVDSVKLLCKRFGLDKEKIICCAWLHDIRYFMNNQKNHAENSLKLLVKEKVKLDKTEKDCILNHGNGKNPVTKEGKIMQIADKISILNPDFLKVLLKQKTIGKEEIGFVKMVCDNAVKLLGELK
jgi:HD superfamily phosphodiesterase